MKRSESCDSYDAEEERVDEPPRSVNPAFSSDIPEGDVCKRGDCKVCPFKNPEVLKELLEKNKEYVKMAQEMLLWKRPVAMCLFVLGIELVFLGLRKLNFGFLANVTLMGIVSIVVKMFVLPHISKVLRPFFSNVVQQGEKGESNRIREPEEVSAFLSSIISKIVPVIKFFKEMAQDQSTMKQLQWAGSLLAFFYLTILIDMRNLIHGIIILVVVLPGIVLHPEVNKQIKQLVEPKPKSD